MNVPYQINSQSIAIFERQQRKKPSNSNYNRRKVLVKQGGHETNKPIENVFGML